MTGDCYKAIAVLVKDREGGRERPSALGLHQRNKLQLNNTSTAEGRMDAIATKQAEQDLDGLIERVIADVQPTILCNDKGDRQ